MAIPSNVDAYILESIKQSLGLPVSTHNMQLKLLSLLTSNNALQDQVLQLQGQLRDKNKKLCLAKNEATINAKAVYKQIEQYQQYKDQNLMLNSKCNNLSYLCDIYQEERNEAEARAALAEKECGEMEKQLRLHKEELMISKEKETNLGKEMHSHHKHCNGIEKFIPPSEKIKYERKEDIGCAPLCDEIKDLPSISLRSNIMPKDYQALSAQLKKLEKDNKILRRNLERAEREITHLSKEFRSVKENNKRHNEVTDSQITHLSKEFRSVKENNKRHNEEKKRPASDHGAHSQRIKFIIENKRRRR